MVIAIIAILAALITVVVVKVQGASKVTATEATLADIGFAVDQYKLRWGDFPPSTVQEVGGPPGNDVNRGIETLVACLASRKKGAPLYQADEERISNVDGDSIDPKLMDWYFGDGGLRELKDVFGNVLFYIHHRDFAAPKPEHLNVQVAEGAKDQKAGVDRGAASNAFLNSGRFQLRSAGPDGVFGTPDDVRPAVR